VSANYEDRKDWDIFSPSPYLTWFHIISKETARWAVEEMEAGRTNATTLGRELGIDRNVLRRQIEYQIGREIRKHPRVRMPAIGRRAVATIQAAPESMTGREIIRRHGLTCSYETVQRWRKRR